MYINYLKMLIIIIFNLLILINSIFFKKIFQITNIRYFYQSILLLTLKIFNKKLNSSYKYLHKFKDVINYLKNILQGLWLKVHARRRRRDPRKLI